uniref:replication initiation protein n=1 Tax=Helicobacter salomonis TaxID=56878 RepID=UPI000CF05877
MKLDSDGSPQSRELITHLTQQIKVIQGAIESPNTPIELQEILKAEKDKIFKEILSLLTKETEQPTKHSSLLDFQQDTPTQQESQQEPLQQTLQEIPTQVKTQETLAISMQEIAHSPAQKEVVIENVEMLEGDPTATKPPAVLAKVLAISSPGQVVLHNDIYKVNLGKLGAWECNLLFSIFNKLKDHGDALAYFTPREVKAMIGAPKIDDTNLLRVVVTLWENVKSANFWEVARFVENGEKLTRRTNYFLFRHFTVVSDETPKLRYMEVGVNTPYFTHLLNDLCANFTSFQLRAFMSLRSKYAKTLYRLLVRFEDVKSETGMCEVHTYTSDFKGFKEFMGIPNNMGIGLIEERILRPSCRELAVPFEEGYDPNNPNRNLPYETIFYVKNKKGRGNKVVGITFCFMPHPHASMQKAIFKRKTQNRIQNTLAQKQKEQTQEKEKQAQPKRPHYNKQERDTLNKFCGLVGPLFVTNPDYYFKEVKLVRVKTAVVGNPSIMCLFQLLDPKNSHDAHYAECHIESIQSFGNVRPPEYFTHAFVDHENFIESFVKNA